MAAKTSNATKVKDPVADAARASGLEKMKAARAVKTAEKKTDVGMTSLGTVTEATETSYWICGDKHF